MTIIETPTHAPKNGIEACWAPPSTPQYQTIGGGVLRGTDVPKLHFMIGAVVYNTARAPNTGLTAGADTDLSMGHI